MRFFLFSLARELHMTVRQLTSNLDSYELQEWSIFFKVAADKTKPLTSDDLKDQLKSAFSGAKAKAKRMPARVRR